MTKVYITTRGEYSGYHFDRAFASRELAESYMAASSALGSEGFNDILESEILETVPSAQIRWSLSARWQKPGTPNPFKSEPDVLGWERPHKIDRVVWDDDEDSSWHDDDPRLDVFVVVEDRRKHRPSPHLYLTVYGWDLKKVRHLFGEKKALLSAEIEGLL